MRKLILSLFLFMFLFNLSYGKSFWGFSLQEKAYYFSNFLDFGLFILSLVTYRLFAFSSETNIRLWNGIGLNDFPRIENGGVQVNIGILGSTNLEKIFWSLAFNGENLLFRTLKYLKF